MSVLVGSRSSRTLTYLLPCSVDDGVLVSILEFLDGIEVSNDAFGAYQAGRNSFRAVSKWNSHEAM